MKKSNLLILVLSVALASFGLQACNDSGGGDKGAVSDTSSSNPVYDSTNNSNALTAEIKLEDDGRMFIDKAASGGMMEVEAGKLAQANGKSQRVKSFGAMMVRDHSRANEELKTLANQMNVTVGPTLMPEHQQHLDMIKKMKGTAFDKHYMKMMAEDHVKDVQLFEETAKEEKEAELQKFAAKTLPVLKMHLDSAKAINSAVSKM
jgi:putative membrane protein